MKKIILKISLMLLFFSFMGTGCKKKEVIREKKKSIEDYIGSYSGRLTRAKMASDGFIVHENAVAEKTSTEIKITHSTERDNFLVVYVSAYNDSILCEFDKTTEYILIRDTAYSFQLRINEFPDHDGIYYHSVSTYGRQKFWETQQAVTLRFDFLKDFNDSIYICSTRTQKIN